MSRPHPRQESTGETRPVLDCNRRRSMAPLAGSLVGFGLGLCRVGWRGKPRLMSGGKFWTGSGRIHGAGRWPSRLWSTLGAGCGSVGESVERMPVQNGASLDLALTILDRNS